MVEANASTLVTSAVVARAGETVVIDCDALGAVNPLAPTGTAVLLGGGVGEHIEASRSGHGRKQRGCAARGIGAGLPGIVSLQRLSAARSDAGRSGPRGAQRRWSDQSPPDHRRQLTGDAAPVLPTVSGQNCPAVTIAVR